MANLRRLGSDAVPTEVINGTDVAPGRSRSDPDGTDRPLWTSLAVLVVLVPFVFGLIAHLLQAGRVFDLGADWGLIDLAGHDAAHGDQLVGLRSQFGWRHPGPVHFYLLSPLSRLYGAGSGDALLGALLVHGAAAVALVAVVRARWGEASARWAALPVLSTVVVMGPDLLSNPWTPMVVVFPMLLTVLLSALAAGGSSRALLGATITGSYAVQTHIPTIPVVAASLGFGLWCWWRSTERRPLTAVQGWVGAAVLVLVWGPPVFEQWFGPQHNMTDVASYFLGGSREAGQGWVDALRAVARQLATPFTGAEATLGLVFANGLQLAVAAAVAVGVAVIAVRRQTDDDLRRFSGLLLVAMAVSVLAAQQTPRLASYLLVSDVGPAVGALMVVAMVIGPRLRSWSRLQRSAMPGSRLVVVAMVVLLGWSALRWTDFDVRTFDTPRVRELSAVITADADDPSESIVIDFDRADRYGVVAGVVRHLEDAGWDVRVPARWDLLFGRHRRADGTESATFLIASEVSTFQGRPNIGGSAGYIVLRQDEPAG